MADEARSGSQDSTAVDRDLLLGRSLIERGVLTSETLHRCLRYQEEQRKLGRSVPLARILVTHGGVDKDVILALRPAEPGALPCPLCRTSLKVEGQVPGKPFRCPSCKAILTMAPDRTSLEVQTRDGRAKGRCPACQKDVPPSTREPGESFPCPFCGSTVRHGPDGQSLILVEKVLAPPADSNRDTAVDPTLPAARGRRAGSTRAAAKSSSGVGSASSRPPSGRRPTSSAVSPAEGARGGSSGSGSASRSTASNVPSTDREDFERRDREYARLLMKKGLLSEAEVEICRSDGEGDRVRGSFLPIVHYAVKRDYLQPGQLKEILTEFRATSASSGAGGVGEKEPTLVDRLDKGSSPLGKRQGEYFAGHEILEELGRGGMGAVYRSRDLVTGQVVALKVLLGGDEASRIHVKRFQREVDLVKSLGHRNIVAIHKFGIEEGYHYFTMDFVDGPTLKDALKNRAMGAKRAVQVFIRILSALDHAHRKGIVHRDLKPSNVILDRDGEPLLTDFGLAKRIDSESQLTKTESAVGTPHYMSPEQVSGGRIRITAQTDLYAVGVMLYQVVAGRLPFRADNQAQLYNQILNEEAEPPSTHNPAVDKSMDTICLKAIAKQAEDRYPTARDFADDLKRYLAGEPIRARPQSKMSRTWRKVKSNPRTTLALSIAVAIAVASVGIAVLLMRSETGGPGATPAEIARKEAQVELERGLRFLESGKAANAAEAFQRALELDPTFTEASLGLARSLAALGDFSGASSILEGVLKEKAGDRDVLLMLGRIALDEGAAEKGKGEEGAASECYERAVRHFTDIIRLYPDDPEGYKGRGDAYQELGLRDEMIGDRTQEKKCRQLQVGNVLLEAGELLGAGKLLEALARVEPYAASLRDDLEVQLLYGRILEAKGSLEKALAAYSICVEKEPNDSRYRVRRARVLVELGRYQGAEEDLAGAKVDPKAGDEAVYLRGRVAEGKGFLAEALPSYDAALVGSYLSEGPEADATNRIVDLRFRRGRTRFRLDDFRGAAGDLDQVLERRPDLVEARFLRGASLVETGEKLRTSQSDLEAAVAGGYQPAYRVDIYQGRLALLAGKPEEALERFRRVAEAMPALPDAFYHRAQAYLAMGKGGEAHADAAEAVRLDPFRARHFKMLGLALSALEDYERAEDAFRKALELDINDFENIIGIFRTLVGQGEFSKVLDLESLVSSAITNSWAISVDLFEAEPEEVRRLYLEDERRAGAAEESRVEGYFWAVAQADPTVREAGVQGLVEAGTPVLDRVIERLAGSSGGEKDALEQVVKGIGAQEARRLRRDVVRSLAKTYLGKDRALFARLRRQRKLEVGVLKEILDDAGEGLAARRLAARALADLRTEEGLAAARELVASGDLLPGAMVAAALVDAGFAVRRDALVRFLKAPDPMVRGLAVLSLPQSSDAMGDLLEALADEDERVRLHAAARLARTQDRRAQDVVVAGRESGDPRSRRLSIRALVQLGQGGGAPHPSVASALTRSLQDDDPIVRRDAAIALGELQIRSAAPSLIGRLEQEHRQDVKVQVILALTNLADREAAKVLKPFLFDVRQDPVIRGVSFFYFFRNNLLDGEVAIGMMQLFRPEEDWVIRTVALVVMGMELPDNPMIAPLLMPHLESEDPRVRGGAAAGLTRTKNSPAANIGAALFKRLQDPDEFVRGATAGALVYRFAHGLDEENETFRTLVETDAAVRRGASAAYYRISVWRGYTPGATPQEQAENKVRYLERAMELRPDERDYPILLAQILTGLGRHDEALVWIERAIAVIPDDSELLAWRAFVRIMLGRPKEAAGDLEKMVAEENPPSWAWRLLGEARSRAQDPQAAADAMRVFWLQEPANVEGHRVVGEALLAAKRYAPLFDMMDDACYRWPEQGYLHWVRARAAAGLGQVDVALAALREAKAAGCAELGQAREAPEFAELVGKPEFESILR